jgi:hypothetical protein
MSSLNALHGTDRRSRTGAVGLAFIEDLRTHPTATDPTEVMERFGVTPDKVVEPQVLTDGSVDNILYHAFEHRGIMTGSRYARAGAEWQASGPARHL